MIFCVAGTISWALVFYDPIEPQPQSIYCYSQESTCWSAREAANYAFAVDRSSRRATCERQPAGDPAKFNSIVNR
jgi:hypothetical protein